MTCSIKGCQNVVEREYRSWCNNSHFKIKMENERNSLIDYVKNHLESDFPNIDFPIKVSWTKTYQVLRGEYSACEHEWIVVNGSKIRWKVHSWNSYVNLGDWEVCSKARSIIRKKIKEREEKTRQKERDDQRQIKADKEYEEAVAKNTIEWNKISKYISSERDGRSYNRYNEAGTRATIFTEKSYILVKDDVTIFLKKAYKDDMIIEGIRVTGLTTGDLAKKLLEGLK